MVKSKCDVCGASTIAAVDDNLCVQTGVTFEYHGCDTRLLGVDNPTLCHNCVRLVVKQMIPKADSSETTCELSAKVSDIEERISGINDDALNVEKRLGEAFSYIQDLNNQHITTNNKLDSYFKMLNGLIADLSGVVDQLNKRVDTQANDVNIDVHGNNQRISALEERMSLVDGSLTELVNEAWADDKALLRRVEDLEHKLSGVNVSEINQIFKSTSAKCDALEKSLVQISSDIIAASATATAIINEDKELALRVERLESEVTSGKDLLDRVQALEHRTLNVDSSLYDLPAKYGLTSDNVAKLKAELDQVASEVRSMSDLITIVATHAEQIHDISRRHDKDIGSLTKAVYDLEAFVEDQQVAGT